MDVFDTKVLLVDMTQMDAKLGEDMCVSHTSRMLQLLLLCIFP